MVVLVHASRPDADTDAAAEAGAGPHAVEVERQVAWRADGGALGPVHVDAA